MSDEQREDGSIPIPQEYQGTEAKPKVQSKPQPVAQAQPDEDGSIPIPQEYGGKPTAGQAAISTAETKKNPAYNDPTKSNPVADILMHPWQSVKNAAEYYTRPNTSAQAEVKPQTVPKEKPQGFFGNVLSTLGNMPVHGAAIPSKPEDVAGMEKTRAEMSHAGAELGAAGAEGLISLPLAAGGSHIYQPVREKPSELSTGIARGAGGFVGSVAGDPVMAGLALTGGAEIPLLSRIAHAAFTADMGKATLDGIKQLRSDWPNLNEAQRAERITQLGLQGIFAAESARSLALGTAGPGTTAADRFAGRETAGESSIPTIKAAPKAVVGPVIRGASGVVTKVAPTVPYITGALAGKLMDHPYLGGLVGKLIIPKEFVNDVLERGRMWGLSDEDAAAKWTQERADTAIKVAAHAKAELNRFKASNEQGNAPQEFVNAYEKAQREADEANYHAEEAARAAKEAKEPKKPQPVAPTAPEVPTEEVSALQPLGKKPAGPQTVSPAHATTAIPQEPTAAPLARLGQKELAGGQGTMGKPLQLTAGNPPTGSVLNDVIETTEAKNKPAGYPQIKPAEVAAPKAPEVGTAKDLKSLKTDGKGNVIDTSDTVEGRLHKALLEALKEQDQKPTIKAPEVPKETPVEKREAERRVSEEPFEGEDRRQAERRVLKQMGEKLVDEALGGEGEKRIDTDAYAEATQQARTELGKDASKEAVRNRRDEIVASKGITAPKGDIGEQARRANPEPTRAETKGKPVLPKEEPTGYTPKKEEVLTAGEEGREQPTPAAEYHPEVRQRVFELGNENLKKLARAHGLDPDAPEYAFGKGVKRTESTETSSGRQQPGRAKLADDITAQMSDEEKTNIGRNARTMDSEGKFNNQDISNLSRAEQAEKLFPRLREGETGVTKEQYEAARKAAQEKIKNGLGVNGGNLPLKEWGVQARYLVEQGFKNIAEFSKKMLADFGEVIRPHLERLFMQSFAEPEPSAFEKALTGEKEQTPLEAAMGRTEEKAKQSPLEAAMEKTQGQTPLESAIDKTMRGTSKDKEAEQLNAHVAKTSSKDTDHIQAAMKELGPEAKLSDVTSRAQDMKATAAQIAEHDKNGGSTFSSKGKDLNGTNKYSVGSYPDRTEQVDKLTPERLDEFKKKNADVLSKDGHAVGTWKDPDTGKVVLDVVKTYSDKDEAIAAGKDANQKAIYHLGGEGEIQTGGTGEGSFPEKIERPTTKIPKGAKELPTGDALIKKYGEGSVDPKHTTFILEDGRTVGNTGTDHDIMLGGKATDNNPPRERFVQEGNIRVRAHQGTAGREVAFSIPESGINASQWEQIKKMAPQLASGAVMIEVGKPGGAYKVIDYGDASPETLRNAILEVTGGEPKSLGSAAAGTAFGKQSPLTPEQLKERLPDLAQKHLTEEEKEGITTTATGKPRTAGTAKFIQTLSNIPEVQEYTDIALAGEGARHWYQRSTKAFDAMMEEAPKYFQPEDRDRFLGFLAASSPRQSVAMNLREALGAWKAYVDAGRPTGKPLENLLRDNFTLPDTKIGNATKALSGTEMWPDLTKNSNFKVPSFARNLKGWLNSVTNDGWMALFAGLDPTVIGKPDSYHPLSVAVRAAAAELGWEPAEAQAAIWSFTQALTERGEELPEEVRKHSEDFVDILAHDPLVRDLLSDLGVSHDNLDAKLKAIGEKPEVSGRTSATTSRSIGKLKGRIEAARGQGIIPPAKSSQGSFEFREAPAHESRVRDEETRFEPSEFGNEEPSLTKLGEKKKTGLKTIR